VSKFTTTQSIEVAHIVPYYGTESDHIENVIPLRTDLHKLFDKGLINITYSEKNKTYEVKVHDSIKNDYGNFHETELSLPSDDNFGPSRFALIEHQELFKHLWQII
jgi:predicted restriction endonuclease